MRPRFLCVTFGILTLAACGDDDLTGPAVPNLVGSYDGTWTTTVEGEGLETTTEVCAGTVAVTEQVGGAFEGTFSQTASEACSEGGGFVTGVVSPEGALTLVLGAPGGGGPAFEESTGCTILAFDEFYTGAYAEGELSFETGLTARCPESGNTDVLWTFAFLGS